MSTYGDVELKKAIVTTTINAPTEAILKFVEIAERDDWTLYIAGDLKTPHEPYYELSGTSDRVVYLHPNTQEQMAGKLSELIGWNCIQRRNFAMLAAYRDGADILALVDDDNIPLDNWGKDTVVGKEVTVECFSSEGLDVFDPLLIQSSIWHRGFPVQLIGDFIKTEPGSKPVTITPLVQANMWAGEPDVDAICRIANGGSCAGELPSPWSWGDISLSGYFTCDTYSPWNSQNTIISREILPVYFLFPSVGRMDDIWAAYITEWAYSGSVVYGPETVIQNRNVHDLVKDLEAEMIGYRHTLDLIHHLKNNDLTLKTPDPWPAWFPERALDAWDEWANLFGAWRAEI